MEPPNNKPKTTTRKVSEIIERRFVLFLDTPTGRVTVDCNPTREDIERAVNDRDFEGRCFHEHDLENIKKDWAAASNPVEKARTDHARRVAYFVVNGWKDEPIELNADGVSVNEGVHRLKAAIFMDKEEVEVKIAGEK